MRKRTQKRLDKTTLYIERLRTCTTNDERDEAVADLLREHRYDEIAAFWLREKRQ